MGKIVTRYFTR